MKHLDPVLLERALERLLGEMPRARSRFRELVQQERQKLDAERPRDVLDPAVQRQAVSALLHDPGVY